MNETEIVKGTTEAVFVALCEAMRGIWVRVEANLIPERFELTLTIATRSAEDADKIAEQLQEELPKHKPAWLWVATDFFIEGVLS